MASAYNSVGSGLPQVPISMPVSTYHHQTSASPTNYSYNTASYQTGGQLSYAAGAQGSYTHSTGERRVTGTTAGGERVESVRKISSTIVEESYLGPRPADLPTRTIEKETLEEREVRVTRKEQREKVVEKRVPQIEWVDRIVEVPRIEYQDRVVEVPVYQDVWVDKRVEIVQDRHVDVVVEKRVPKINKVFKDVEVPGQVIEVPKPYAVEVPVNINRYTDRQVPMVVAQTIKPYIVEGQGEYEVDVLEYEAECVPVDVHVIKPVATNIEAYGVVDSVHRVISVPAAQYNTMLQQLNQHLTATEVQKLPYVSGVGGAVQFLSERISYTQPQAGVEIQGWNPATAVNTWTGERSTTSTTATTMATAHYGASAHYGGSAQYIANSGQYAGSAQVAAGQFAASAQYTSAPGAQYSGQASAIYAAPATNAATTQYTSTTTTTTGGQYGGPLNVVEGQVVTSQPLITSH